MSAIHARGFAPEGDLRPVCRDGAEENHADDHRSDEHEDLPVGPKVSAVQRRPRAQANEAPADAEQGGPADQTRVEVAAGRELQARRQDWNAAALGDDGSRGRTPRRRPP